MSEIELRFTDCLEYRDKYIHVRVEYNYNTSDRWVFAIVADGNSRVNSANKRMDEYTTYNQDYYFYRTEPDYRKEEMEDHIHMLVADVKDEIDGMEEATPTTTWRALEEILFNNE